MKHLQICMFNSDFYLQQVQILHLDVKVEIVQLQKLENPQYSDHGLNFEALLKNRTGILAMFRKTRPLWMSLDI